MAEGLGASHVSVCARLGLLLRGAEVGARGRGTVRESLHAGDGLGDRQRTGNARFMLLRKRLILLSSRLCSSCKCSNPFEYAERFSLSRVTSRLRTSPRRHRKPGDLMLRLLRAKFVRGLRYQRIRLNACNGLGLSG